MAHGYLVTPKDVGIHLTDVEMRRLFSLARLGLQAAKDRGMTSTVDQTLETVLHSDRVKF